MMLFPKCLTFTNFSSDGGSNHDWSYYTYSFDKRPTGPIRIEKISNWDSGPNEGESYPLDNGIIPAYIDENDSYYNHTWIEIYYYDDDNKEKKSPYPYISFYRGDDYIIRPDDLPSYDLIKLIVCVEYDD